MNNALIISGTTGHVGAWRKRAVRVCCQRATSDIILLSHMIDRFKFKLGFGCTTTMAQTLHSSSNSRNVDGENIIKLNSKVKMSEILHNHKGFFKLLR